MYPHPLYLALGSDIKTRRETYQDFFKVVLSETDIAEIRQSTNKGMAIGKDSFKMQIEALSGRRLTENKRGRPVGWRKNKN